MSRMCYPDHFVPPPTLQLGRCLVPAMEETLRLPLEEVLQSSSRDIQNMLASTLSEE